MSPDYIKERIKLLSEWFKLIGTLLVLDSGAIGVLISKNTISEVFYLQLLLYMTFLIWVVLLSVLFYISRRITILVNNLN